MSNGMGFGADDAPDGSYGDHDYGGGEGRGYPPSWFEKALIGFYNNLYAGNSSLLGKNWGNTGVFGGPMVTSGPKDTRNAMTGGYLQGLISNTPHNSQLTTVDIRDPNRNTPHNSQLTTVDIRDPSDVLDLGGGMAGSGAMSGNFSGMTPGNSDGGLISEGGGERPWWIRPRRNYIWDEGGNV